MTDQHPPSDVPLEAFTPDQLGAYADSHIIMALEAADKLTGDRQAAEDYVRDRLAATSDTWPDPSSLEAERRRRTLARIRRALRL